MKFIIVLMSLLGLSSQPVNAQNKPHTNLLTEDRMLLALSAPSIYDTYYKSAFQQIVNFQINYAKKIIGFDNILILVDKDTVGYYKNKVPDDILLIATIDDIWMRDFTTINPSSPVQMTYTWASMTKAESIATQKSFSTFADKHNLERKFSDYLLDGGNIVDNYKGKAVVTTRFFEDNYLKKQEAKLFLKELLKLDEIAIIDADEEVLAHSDGVVMWIDDNTLAINNYKSIDDDYRYDLLGELKTAFPATKIIEIPVEFKDNKQGEWEGFSSACGVNVNAVLTHKNLYVPTFNMAHEKQALDLIRKNTSKNVITIEAEAVCPMGGSVRCLTWQVTGKNAEKLIIAARNSTK